MADKAWGGRFQKATNELVEEFTQSISFDQILVGPDIAGSMAHASMLGKCGIITKAEADKIMKGLGEVFEDILSGEAEFDASAEDIHMNVERLLFDKIGDVAGKLHTARSRNDQIALDIRLYLKIEIPETARLIEELQTAILDQAEKHVKSIMPGLTHTQHAQPVTLGHHLMAWFWMLERDKNRMYDCLARVDVCPLGSGALAGTTFPIDREFVAEELDFAGVTENSIDSVSDRDFISEYLSAAAILMTHLSRFSEEIILWNTPEFGFIELDDSVTTGSSIMPQKKNPDCAELIRGKTGRVIGSLMALLTLQKGLPMAYNRDLQEDKESLFDAAETVQMSLQVFALMLATAKFNTDRMYKAASAGFSTATDLADHLVRQGVAFRTAHEHVGKLVAYCVEKNKELTDLSLDEIRKFAPAAGDDVKSVLTVEASVNARSATGGTAPSAVKKQIKKARKLLG